MGEKSLFEIKKRAFYLVVLEIYLNKTVAYGELHISGSCGKTSNL